MLSFANFPIINFQRLVCSEGPHSFKNSNIDGMDFERGMVCEGRIIILELLLVHYYDLWEGAQFQETQLPKLVIR